jgi:hypothetical protein
MMDAASNMTDAGRQEGLQLLDQINFVLFLACVKVLII